MSEPGRCAADLFVVWELFDNPHPVVDVTLFARRNFWTGTLAFALGYGVFFGIGWPAPHAARPLRRRRRLINICCSMIYRA